MNRRGFFTGLGAILATASAPGLFLPKFEPVRWKLNPDWESAQLELVMSPDNPFNMREFYGSWKFVSFDTGADAKAYPAECVSKVFE